MTSKKADCRNIFEVLPEQGGPNHDGLLRTYFARADILVLDGSVSIGLQN